MEENRSATKRSKTVMVDRKESYERFKETRSVLCLFVVLDVEISQLIVGLVAGHHSKVLFQLLLLEVLFGEVLQISLREGNGC